MDIEVDFDEVEVVLVEDGVRVGAAEGHGVLVGMLCAAPDAGLEHWLARLGEAAVVDSEGPLARLYRRTRRDLEDGGMAFTPLLPDEDEPLSRRVHALGKWCEGFLYGLGATGGHDRQALTADGHEVLRDFAEIARVNAELGSGSERDEAAYMEILEYVRVGVMTIHAELGSTPGSPQSDKG